MSLIREATGRDFDLVWPFFRQIVQEGRTYALATDLSREQAEEFWMRVPQRTFIAADDSGVLGSYFIKPNAFGPGSHVCNCGYMVSSAARGKGVATTMCEHSQLVAVEFGYKAMQFNSVVTTNTRAIDLWHRLGFETVGRLPGAFDHPEDGYVDCLVMFKWLTQAERPTTSPSDP